ncbi:MAG: ABC transporter substrate-binding protein [Sulfurifustaceae bacterium]
MLNRKWVLACVALLTGAFLGISALAATAPAKRAAAQPKEQFIPMFTFKEGAAAPLGVATLAGYLDYWNLLNLRDGGINGVKIVWEECEMERELKRGLECYEKLIHNGPPGRVATTLNPNATDLAYALLKRVAADKITLMTPGYGRTDTSDGSVFPWVFPTGTNYWNQNTAKIRYIGMRLGGMDKLRGKTIVNLHHGSAFGTETKEILEIQAKKYGFKVVHIPVPPPGTEQEEQWKQIMQIKPDWVILRGIGAMNPAALITAHKHGYPASRILGVTWAGAEADVLPAGAAARGYIAATTALNGKDFPVIQDIVKYVYNGAHKGALPDVSKIGSTYYNRALSGAILITEAIRTGQARFGKRPLTGEEYRWGLEHLNLSDRRIAELGALGISQPTKVSCSNHEGGGTMRFQRWNGREWVPVTGWIEGDQAMTRPLIEKSAAEYAKKEGIAPRDCAKEEAAARL